MSDRIERLASDAADLKVTSSGKRDGLYQVAGALAMGVGVVVAFLAYQMSLGTDDSRDIESLTILAVTMLALAVAGAAVFLRYSLARFLRFWLLRQLVESQEHMDRLVEALGVRQPAGQGGGSAAPGDDGTVPSQTGSATSLDPAST